MEFSKKLLIYSAMATFVLSILTIYFSVKQLPLDGLNIVTPLSWAETGAATGFYYWKSKNDNRAKYAQRFIREFANEWGADTAVRIAEIVLKD